jgi:hypothetical protein
LVESGQPDICRAAGYILLTVMLAPTMNCWNLYDVAIVAIGAGALLLLAQERWVVYLLLFALGTRNHENILMLVPAAGLYAATRPCRTRALLFALAQVAISLALRLTVLHLVHGRPA